MECSTIFAGFGGQGLLFAGHVLARAAMAEGREVVWLPSYGPEMRGGTASCTVIVGDEPIGSPVVDRADAVVALNPPSLARYGPLVAKGGLLVVNTSLIEATPDVPGAEVIAIPCSRLAKEAGDDRVVSIVGLGALLARRPIVSTGAIREALAAILGEKGSSALEADLAGLEAGICAALEALGPEAEEVGGVELDGCGGGNGRVVVRRVAEPAH